MKSLLGKVGVILIGLAIFGYAKAWGEDWKLYGSTENHKAYYDTQSITHPSKNIVKVYLKWDYTKKGVMNWVNDYGKEYENISHSIFLHEINCVENKLRRLSATNYDHKGNVIDSISSKSKWMFFIQESRGGGLFKEVCK